MYRIITQAQKLAATGNLFVAKLNGEVRVSAKIVDIGTATVTYEESDDNSTYTSLGTATAKGRVEYVPTKKYFRARVSAYTDGEVVAEFDFGTNPVDPNQGDLISIPGVTGVAGAGADQAAATALPYARAVTITSGTANTADGVRLPAAKAGREMLIRNMSGVAIDVFPASGDKINALSANAAITVNNNASLLVRSPANGLWIS